MSGPKLAAIYGLIPNKLGFCGPKQTLLKKFLAGDLTIPEILPTLEKFEAAYRYYCLIAEKNKISSPFNKRVVEAYWLGNELLDKVSVSDLRRLITEKFSAPGLLSKEAAARKAAAIPEDSRPHHSFHVLVLGAVTGSVNFAGNTRLKDTCRIGWGRIVKIKDSHKITEPGRITVSYSPLTGKKVLGFGPPAKKDLVWDKILLPSAEIGDWISFHWNYAIQKLNEENIINLHKYTSNTLNSLSS